MLICLTVFGAFLSAIGAVARQLNASSARITNKLKVGARQPTAHTAHNPWAQHAQHNATQRSTTQRSAAQRSAAQHSTAQHSTAQHSTAQHSTAQHSTARITAHHDTLHGPPAVAGHQHAAQAPIPVHPPVTPPTHVAWHAQTLQAFMIQRQVPRRLRNRIKAFFDYTTRRQVAKEEQEFINGGPSG